MRHLSPELRAYCSNTSFSDVEHPAIQELAWSLAAEQKSERESAIAIFNWVQDNVRYSILHNWSQTASQTLAMMAGSCSNKANLLVTMLRVVGIPAGFHIMYVMGKYYFGPCWVPMVQQFCDDKSIHVHAAVYLNQRWIKCDPSDDRELSENSAHVNPPCQQVVFDGENHGLLNIDPAYVLGTSELLPSLDSVLSKKTEKPPIYFKIMDLLLECARKEGLKYDHHSHAEPTFRRFLISNHPEVYNQFLACEAELRSQTTSRDYPEKRGSAAGQAWLR